MSLKFIKQNYLKYNEGKGYICGHIDALHATPPKADVCTDAIVETLMENTGCAGIISTVSRTVADLNRRPNEKNKEAIQEYRECIKEIIHFLNILDTKKNKITAPYLHLSFHGMKDDHYGPYGMEVGTVYGKSCSKEVKEWFIKRLIKKTKELIPHVELAFDEKFIGDESIVYHRCGDGQSYAGYGDHFHTFQIELSRTLRSKHLEKIIVIFSDIIADFQKEFIHD